MSVRDLFEKKYADAIENLSDDVLEIFDYLLDRCEEVEYTRDIQRKRICDLERENNVLKNFLFESESIEENSDEIGDILADANELCRKISLMAEISLLADSISTRCKTLRASTDRLQKQREDCELSLGAVSQASYESEDGAYLADDGSSREDAADDVTASEVSPDMDNDKSEVPDTAVDTYEQITLDIFDSEPENSVSESEEPVSVFRMRGKSRVDASGDASVKKEREKKQYSDRLANDNVSDDEISDITSRLKSMLDEGDVKATKRSSDDEEYSNLIKLFFTDNK